MRNLKKILALVLALVMSLSLMATAGAGSFQDVTDDNPYKTAIDVLDELKVFQGFEDGTFKPDSKLNRAQAAVLVYRIATGDVEGKYVANYTDMAQSKFDDLTGYEWARGYINYCQNAKIVVGTSATKFSPEKDVTGYQLMVMLLRTLGYGAAGEFSNPTSWELETAKIAEREGILKNVTGGDFGAAAPRQMVAEILFRGILHDTVEYSPLTPGGYTNSGVALGKKTLGLDDIEGVVVANHIADLYDTEPMKDGQTRMVVDGKDYVIDTDTDATAIGLNHHAYVKDGKVLGGTLEAAGNVIGEPEHGEASKVADLAKNAGIKVTSDTEHYLNFDKNIQEYSEWRLEYNVKFKDVEDQAWFNGKIGLKVEDVIKDANKLDTVNADGYTRIIPRGDKITPEDVAIMKGIFTYADNEDSSSLGISGYVFAGTNSQEEVKRNLDLSDTMKWSDFYKEYIMDDDSEIKSSDNGEWLRVIDNNGDGVAEYVLRTDFIMTTVVDYEKRTELYNVEYDAKEDHKVISKIPADEIRKDDDVDMSVGAVILYTYIDGYYYISNPEVKTLKVDTKSIDQKKNTFTADDEPYTWSGIDKEAERYYTDISQISYDVNYDMYLDHFGFVRLATESRRNFVLLTDGWFYTDNRNPEYKADLYDGETFVENVEVVDNARDDDRWNGDGFIDTYEADHKGNRGTWLRLNTFGEYYNIVDDNGQVAPNDIYWDHYIDPTGGQYKWTDPAKGSDYYTSNKIHGYKDPFVTNIALGSETDGKWTLEDVEDLDVEFNGLYREYNAYELAGTNNAYGSGASQRSVKAKSTDLWGIISWTDDAHKVADTQAIQTNGSTLYYLVKNPGAKDQSVVSWVGYQNVPESEGNFVAERAYAVTHKVLNGNYEIADVVVFEGIYGAPVYDPQLITTGINTKSERALGKDDEGNYTEHRVTFELFEREELLANAKENNLWTPQLNFYDSTYSKGKAPITENYAKYGIYAGEVIVADETKHNDYIEISDDGTMSGNRIGFHSDDVAAYEIDQLTKYGDEAAHNLDVEVNDNILHGDKLIVVKAGDDVKMIVNVSASGIDGKSWADRRTGAENDANKIAKLEKLYDRVNKEWISGSPDSLKGVLSAAEEAIDDLDRAALKAVIEKLDKYTKDTSLSVADSKKAEDMLKAAKLALAKANAIFGTLNADGTSTDGFKQAVETAYNNLKDDITDEQLKAFENELLKIGKALDAALDAIELGDANYESTINTALAKAKTDIAAAVTAANNGTLDPVIVTEPEEAGVTIEVGTPEPTPDGKGTQVDADVKFESGLDPADNNNSGIDNQIQATFTAPAGFVPTVKDENIPADATSIILHSSEGDIIQVKAVDDVVTWTMTVILKAEAFKDDGTLKEEVTVKVTLVAADVPDTALSEAKEAALASLDALQKKYGLDTAADGAYATTKAAIEAMTDVDAVKALLDAEGVLDYNDNNKTVLRDLKIAINKAIEAAKPTVDIAVAASRIWAAFLDPTTNDRNPDGTDKTAKGTLYDEYKVECEESGKDAYDVTITATNVREHLNGAKNWGYWVGFNFAPTDGWTLSKLEVDGVQKSVTGETGFAEGLLTTNEDDGKGVVIDRASKNVYFEAGTQGKKALVEATLTKDSETVVVTFNVTLEVTTAKKGNIVMKSGETEATTELMAAIGVEKVDIDEANKAVTITVDEKTFNETIASKKEALASAGRFNGKDDEHPGVFTLIITEAPETATAAYWQDGEVLAKETEFVAGDSGAAPYAKGWFIIAKYAEDSEGKATWTLNEEPGTISSFYFVDANGARLTGVEKWTCVVEVVPAATEPNA